jgi:hypothetical protein
MALLSELNRLGTCVSCGTLGFLVSVTFTCSLTYNINGFSAVRVTVMPQPCSSSWPVTFRVDFLKKQHMTYEYMASVLPKDFSPFFAYLTIQATVFTACTACFTVKGYTFFPQRTFTCFIRSSQQMASSSL